MKKLLRQLKNLIKKKEVKNKMIIELENLNSKDAEIILGFLQDQGFNPVTKGRVNQPIEVKVSKKDTNDPKVDSRPSTTRRITRPDKPAKVEVGKELEEVKE